jgi:LmbE family N-acetylglucosaminyl deacetylase
MSPAAPTRLAAPARVRTADADRAEPGGLAPPPAPNPIDAPGTSEATWRAWLPLADLPELDISSWTSAVILAAHPDDEVLGAGGIISQLAAAGARLRVIAVTNGEAAPDCADAAALARRRARERSAALHALGAGGTEVLRLGLPDAGLTGRATDVADRIADLVTGFDVCLAPWEHDVHGDHEAVGRAGRLVSGRQGSGRQGSGRAFFYPVWTWHWAAPADPRVPWHQAVRVPLPPAVAECKEAAIECFASQLRAGQPGEAPVLTEGFVTHFTRRYEVLIPVTGR